MDRGRVVQSTVERRWRGPKAPEHGGALTGGWPPATLEHESSPAGAQQREGNTGNPAQASPGLGGGEVARRRRETAVVVGARWGGSCGVRSEERRAGVSVVMARGAPRPFIVAGEGHAGARKGETADSNGLNANEGREA
jgi:hypothetical protein